MTFTWIASGGWDTYIIAYGNSSEHIWYSYTNDWHLLSEFMPYYCLFSHDLHILDFQRRLHLCILPFVVIPPVYIPLCSMTHDDITMGNDIARDVHCNITMGNHIAKYIHCDNTMGNDIARDVHCNITMSNDIAKYIHCNITMGNDIAKYIHCDITMGNDIAKHIHCDITMCNDIARDVHCDITMSKMLLYVYLAMNIFCSVLLHLLIILLFHQYTL